MARAGWRVLPEALAAAAPRCAHVALGGCCWWRRLQRRRRLRRLCPAWRCERHHTGSPSRPCSSALLQAHASWQLHRGVQACQQWGPLISSAGGSRGSPAPPLSAPRQAPRQNPSRGARRCRHPPALLLWAPGRSSHLEWGGRGGRKGTGRHVAGWDGVGWAQVRPPQWRAPPPGPHIAPARSRRTAACRQLCDRDAPPRAHKLCDRRHLVRRYVYELAALIHHAWRREEGWSGVGLEADWGGVG